MSPRALTPDEVRTKVLDHMRDLVKYWAGVEGKSVEDRISGALFSTLSMLDGCSYLPAFDLVAKPCSGDKEYLISVGEDWIEDETRVSCQLHEYWYK